MHIGSKSSIGNMHHRQDAAEAGAQYQENGGKDAPLGVTQHIHGRHVAQIWDLRPRAINTINSKHINHVHPVTRMVVLHEVN